MRSALIAMLGIAALAGLATPAFAQTAADKADGRCVLVMQVAAREPKNKEAATSAIFYYLGRLNAHGLSAKLGAIMIGEAKGITSPQQAQTELTRCGAELNARNAELRIGLLQLQAAGQAAAAAAAKPKPPT